MADLLKNTFGSVRPYTRHVDGCSNTDDSCRCPKWLYENRRGCNPRRYTLKTPSMAEAQRIAADKLRSFDPEIAAARAVTTKRDAGLMTVKKAGDMWIESTRRKHGTDGRDPGVLQQYKTLMDRLTAWANREHIDYVQDITPLHLESWYSSRDWKRYAPTTRRQRWECLKWFFKFLTLKKVIEWHSNPIVSIDAVKVERDHVQGPYTQEQVDLVFAHIVDTVPVNVKLPEREIYAARVHAFITMLLHTGCDVGDAILFDLTRIEDVMIDGRVIPVYSYKRQKTGVKAIIPLSDDIAKVLRSVPTTNVNPKNMPFRNSKNELTSEVHCWGERVKRVLDAAGVEWVELPDGRRKEANSKQFRHTFAVRQLERRLRPEVIARQLGHVDATMVRKHYAPWVKSLDDAHIREVLAAR